jgi:flagellar assembly protein FliH
MSTIIKAGQSTRLLQRLSGVDLADHLVEARRMLAEAKQRAADISARADDEAERARTIARAEASQVGYHEGYEKGYKEGREAGLTQGHREAFERESAKLQEEQAYLIADLQRAVEEIAAVKQTLQADAEAHVLDFAIKLATKLTYAIGSLSDHAVRANLSRALQLVYERTNLTVRLHPEDLRAFEQLAPAAAAQLRKSHDVRFTADEAIARGGCVVVGARTEVDATLDTQLSEIVSLLTGRTRNSADAATTTERAAS